MTKSRPLIVVLICLVIFVILAPIETSVIPQWTVQVVDVNGTACANMRVTQSWGHYRLYLDGNSSSDDRLTDLNGYVQFPQTNNSGECIQTNHHADSYARSNHYARRMGS